MPRKKHGPPIPDATPLYPTQNVSALIRSFFLEWFLRSYYNWQGDLVGDERERGHVMLAFLLGPKSFDTVRHTMTGKKKSRNDPGLTTQKEDSEYNSEHN